MHTVSPFTPENSHHTEVAESGRASNLNHVLYQNLPTSRAVEKLGHCSQYPLSSRSFISAVFLLLSAMRLFRILWSRNQVPLPPECPCTSVAGLPQQSPTGWLKTTDVYSFTVLEVRSPKSRCRQGHAPSETCGESFLAADGLLENLGKSCPQSFNPCFYHHGVLSSVSMSLLNFL